MIIGEVHDNPAHHQGQAEAVAAIAPAAIVFEMLTSQKAAAVGPGNRDDAKVLSEALGWEESGWPDFEMYHPIFTAAPAARVYGGALIHDDIRRSVSEGAASVMGGDAAAFGLDLPLPEEELALRVEEQAVAHCGALPEDMLPGMVEAQRLRDAALARATLAALDETGGPVVVITGNGHARRDRGIPVYLETARPGVDILSVGQLESPPDDGAPFDVWRVTEPAERDDPCDTFR